MACLLMEQGHCVGRLVVMDMTWPGWRLTAGNAWPTLARSFTNLPGLVPQRLRTLSVPRLRHMLRGWAAALRGRSLGMESLVDIAAFDTAELPLLHAHARAVRAFRPRVHRMPVAVMSVAVQGMKRLQDSPAMGWDAVSLGPPDTAIVAGTHWTMAAEPHVQSLARAIDAALAIPQDRD